MALFNTRAVRMAIGLTAAALLSLYVVAGIS